MKIYEKKWIIIAVIVILLLPLGFTLAKEYLNSDKQKPVATQTIKEKIEGSIYLDNKKEVKFNDINKILIVDLDLKQGLDNKSRRMLAKEDISNVLKQSKKNIEDIDEILISFYADLENTNGEKSNEEVYRVRYNSEEINKINFENINILEIDSLADDTFIHPAFN